jgi:hypothetical protein
MSPLTEAHPLLETSKVLIKSGRAEEAKTLLLQLIQEDPHNGRAWYAYSFVADGLERQIDALEKTLVIRPDSRRATHRLRTLMQLRSPNERNTEIDLVADTPTVDLLSNRLAPRRKHKLPRALLVTGVLVAGAFVVLLVLSVGTLIDASQPRVLPTLVPLGSSGETNTAYPSYP